MSFGGHDDYAEQTLNQILTEMDGFTGAEGVIVIAATNSADVLDPRCLRQFRPPCGGESAGSGWAQGDPRGSRGGAARLRRPRLGSSTT